MSTLSPRSAGAVRVLHTSDWHLGVTVRGVPRGVDHDAAIAELVDIAAEADPDLIVHTGDLFDTARPPMVELGRAIAALRRLTRVAPLTVIAGNHDSAATFEVLALALDAQDALVSVDATEATTERVRVLPRAVPANEGAVATYRTRAGGLLRLVALPFVHQNRVVRSFEELVAPNATYNDALRSIVSSYEQLCFTGFDPVSDVAVFASHVHVRGARISTEKTVHVAEHYATDPAHLSERYGYLAFGHIHVPQPVGAGRGRYAGSLLEVDFGELGEAKQVVVVDLVPGRPADIQEIPLSAGRRLHRVRDTVSALVSHAERVGDGIVEVTVVAGTADAGEAQTVVVGDTTFDTLSAAVRAAFPAATVVSVIDARRPRETLGEVAPPSESEDVVESFSSWVASDAAAGLRSRDDTAGADPQRVAEIFRECYNAAMLDTETVLVELSALQATMEFD